MLDSQSDENLSEVFSWSLAYSWSSISCNSPIPSSLNRGQQYPLKPVRVALEIQGRESSNDKLKGWFTLHLAILNATDMVPPQTVEAVSLNIGTDGIHSIAIFDTVFESILSSLSTSCNNCILIPHLDLTSLNIYAPSAEKVQYRACICFWVIKEHHVQWS